MQYTNTQHSTWRSTVTELRATLLPVIKVGRANQARNQLGRCEMNTKISDLGYPFTLARRHGRRRHRVRTHTNSHTWFRFTQVLLQCYVVGIVEHHWDRTEVYQLPGLEDGQVFNFCEGVGDWSATGADLATLSRSVRFGCLVSSQMKIHQT